ncbi:hypothetical protein Q8W71_05450 [Methylobacterium sp. NEAU 140]|uniref:hypothetical protein n=1 Tax=Methylobacterium sp. NEAU 140 TaxID=3064945 RepID=UPI002733BFBF|nr:hypothetical protein [Methylobacterium sp. NEAU 140]MDP4022058.1 hypothetical protein [Methylobacterium sp. NEAU 140]
MSNLISRLLGRRKPTSSNLTGQIDAQRAALADAQARAAAAAEARRQALDEGNNAGLRGADEARDTARRDAEIAEHAINGLEAALAEAHQAETRDAFRAEVDDVRRAGVALTDRIRAEYPRLAAELAGLLGAIEDHNSAKRRLTARGKELGETVEIGEVEAFRRTPRPGKSYAGLGYSDLIDAIDHLPGLHAGDDSIRLNGFR